MNTIFIHKNQRLSDKFSSKINNKRNPENIIFLIVIIIHLFCFSGIRSISLYKSKLITNSSLILSESNTKLNDLILTPSINLFSLKNNNDTNINSQRNIIDFNYYIANPIKPNTILTQNFLQEKGDQIYSQEEKSSIKVFLEIISSTNTTSFCIKRYLGKPQSYKSYKCPAGLKIFDDSQDVCIQECRTNYIRNKDICQEKCEIGYVQEYDLCINRAQEKKYKALFYSLEKADPICINGFFSNGLCYSCFGNSEHSNGECLSPCSSGSPSDYFCSFTDEANKGLSLMNPFWSKALRELYDDLLIVSKDNKVSISYFNNSSSLKEISSIIVKNSKNAEMQNICGKIMVYMRDKLRLNLGPNWETYLRTIFLKMFTRFENNESSNVNYVLAVVDDLIYFKGDYTSDYLQKKNFGLENLALTVAYFLDHICQ